MGRQRPVVAGASGLEGAMGAVAAEGRFGARCCCVEGIPPGNLFDHVLQPASGGPMGTNALGSLTSKRLNDPFSMVKYRTSPSIQSDVVQEKGIGTEPTSIGVAGWLTSMARMMPVGGGGISSPMTPSGT